MDLAQSGLRGHAPRHFYTTQKAPSHFSSSNSNNNNNNSSIGPMTSGVNSSTSEAVSSTGASSLPSISHPIQHPVVTTASISYSYDDKSGSLTSWDPSFSSMPYPTAATTSQDISIHQGYLPLNHWGQKPCADTYVPHNLDSDGPIGQAYTTDDAIPIVDFKYTNALQGIDYSQFYTSINSRPVSGSSFTMSTTGPASEPPSYDDFPAMSDAPPFNSEYPPASNRTSMMSSTQLSPIPSPRLTPQSRPEQVRSQSRGRASASPRPSMRSAPYNVEGPRGTKRWSSGSYAATPNKRQALHSHSAGQDMSTMSQQKMSLQVPEPRSILPSSLPLTGSDYSGISRPPFMGMDSSMLHRSQMLLPSQMPPYLASQTFHADPHRFDQPPPLPSQGMFRMLQSNGSPHSFHGHYTDLSDPPDLFAALHEEQLQPPPEDMNPSDPEMTPYEQDLRFEGDLYTPRWVRGHGNKREGWCGICKPGRWLVLKNSAYWYDKSFTHGISAATGSSFQEPLDSRRMDGSPDVWEGLCGSCSDWIALVSSKKKGTTWFRHAYKCHTHPKVKDSLKRRRDNNQTRVIAAQVSLARVKSEEPMPSTPQGGTPVTGFHTPQSTDIPHSHSMDIPHSHPYSPDRPQKSLAPAPLHLVNSNKEFGPLSHYR